MERLLVVTKQNVLTACFIVAICLALHTQARDHTTLPKPPLAGDWPSQFEGHRLEEQALSAIETKVFAKFPGTVRRYQAGDAQLIMRRIHTATRLLHPGADCFRAMGYKIKNYRNFRDEQGRSWSQFDATLGTTRLKVRELITGPEGDYWTDPGQWYWHVLWQSDQGPWTSYLVAEHNQLTESKEARSR